MVWTTAILFFQTALLAGYGYAHLSVRWLSTRCQMRLQGAFLLVGILVLPVGVPTYWSLDTEGPIAPQILALLFLMIGLPFVALSANAPLLQAWFCTERHNSRHDPYSLYAASNSGSIAALLAVPFVVEPYLGTTAGAWLWTGVYAVLICLLGILSPRKRSGSWPVRGSPVPTRRWLSWIGLAALPSAMMLSTTQVIATDLGSFPLVWIIPVAVYLLTFVCAFSRRARLPDTLAQTSLLIALTLAILLVANGQVKALGWTAFGILLAAFAATALACHTRLYDDRPETSDMTAFYLAVAAGGALGGIAVGVAAPFAFSDLTEVPIILALSGLILRGNRRATSDVAIGLFLAGLAVTVRWAAGTAELTPGLMFLAFTALPGIFLLLAARRKLQFVTLATGLLIAGTLSESQHLVHQERSFFGVYKVVDRPDFGLRLLTHGTTMHGQQFMSEPGSRPTPLAYYHAAGPLAQGIKLQSQEARIGVIGLGAGSLACHARRGQTWTFFEIDPVVDRIARDPNLFAFLDRCGDGMETVIGDARVTLRRHRDLKFDLLIIDAFVSDAIPIHLITVEAFEMYRERLAPGGVILVHATNRFFDVPRLVARAAARAHLTAVIRIRSRAYEGPLEAGETASVVVALSNGPSPFARDRRWHELKANLGPVWTDDHADLLSALRW